jgi:hypothetical protein
MNDNPRETPETSPEPVQRPRTRRKVDPESDSRLAALLTSYREAKERESAAKAEAAELQSHIVSELASVAGDDVPDVFDISADPMGGYPAFTYRYTPPGLGLDSEKMKSEDPVTYVKFLKERRGYWTFEAKKTGRGRR